MIQSYFIFPGLPQSMPLDELIIEAVCGAYDTTYEQINCKCRRRELCECRQVIMALLYMSGKFSLVKVGLKFKRDHATVSHAVKTVKNLWDSSFDFRAKVIPILKKLNLPDKIQSSDTAIYGLIIPKHKNKAK